MNHCIKIDMMIDNNLSGAIVRAAFEIHSELGPGLLESTYQHCLAHRFAKHGLQFEREKAIPLVFDGTKLECGYRADFLVEKKIIVELKSVEAIADIHIAQMLTYLKIGNFNLGLLLNFNALHMKDGVRRIILS